MYFCDISFGDCPKSFHYCGYIPKFSLYVPLREFISVVHIVHGEVLSVDIHLIFSVISAQVIESCKHRSSSRIAIYSVKRKQAFSYYFRVQVHKYQGIVVQSNTTHNSLYLLLFDGPSYLSHQQKLKANFTLHRFKTFQCSIVMSLPTYKINLKDTINFVHFTGKNLPRKTLFVTEKTAHMIYFSNHATHVWFLHTMANHYLKVTVLSFKYEGPPSVGCIYGGMSLYDFRHNEFIESISLCDKYKFYDSESVFQGRIFYSDNSSILVLAYCFKEYSSIRVKLEASVSYCRGTKINTCEINISKTNFAQKVLLERNKLFQLIQTKLKLNFLIFHKSCFALQFHINFRVAKYCGFFLQMTKEQTPHQLWTFSWTGYIKGPNTDHPIVYIVGNDPKTKVSIKHFETEKDIKGCRFDTEKLREVCRYWSQSNMDIVLDVEYPINTPVHDNSIVTALLMHPLSQSWANVIVKWGGDAKTIVTELSSLYRPSYMKRIIKIQEAAVLMHVSTKEAFKLQIKALSYNLVGQVLGWSNVISLENDKINSIILALPGTLKYVEFGSLRNVSASLEYIFGFIMTSRLPKSQGI